MGESIDDNPLLESAGKAWLLGFKWQTQKIKKENNK